MPDTGCDVHDVANLDLFDRTAASLYAAHAGCHDQRLCQRVRVPCGPRAWREGHRPHRRAVSSGWFVEHLDLRGAGEVLRGRSLHSAGAGTIDLQFRFRGEYGCQRRQRQRRGGDLLHSALLVRQQHECSIGFALASE
jgi:hypothetical protein